MFSGAEIPNHFMKHNAKFVSGDVQRAKKCLEWSPDEAEKLFASISLHFKPANLTANLKLRHVKRIFSCLSSLTETFKMFLELKIWISAKVCE